MLRHPMGVLTFIFYQKIFYDKMDCRLFHFRVTICPQISNIKRVLTDISRGHLCQTCSMHTWKKKKKRKKRSKISTYSPYYIGKTSHRNYVFVCNNIDHCKVDQGVHME